MNAKERDSRLAEIILGISELFNGKLSTPGVRLWMAALDGYSLEQIQTAASEIIKTRVYSSMPTPAEFIKSINGNPEQRAEVEAGKVLDAVAQVGSYNSVVFDDPVTIAVIRQGFGGWINLCKELSASGKDQMWFRKDFVRIYTSYAEQGVKGHGSMAGIIEAENRAAGYLDHIHDPYLVGDKNKARKLFETKDEQIAPQRLIELAGGVGMGA